MIPFNPARNPGRAEKAGESRSLVCGLLWTALLVVTTLLVPTGRAQTSGAATGVTSGITPAQTPAQLPAQNPYAAAASQATTPTGSVPTTAMLYPGEDFLLGPGDLITVRLFGSTDYSATIRVDTEGNVELPYIGSVHVQGETVHQAQLLIADRLRSGGFYLNPEIILQVVESINSSVTIAGEVRAIVPITGARRLIDVISAAGGLPPAASHTVRIIRPGQKEPMVLDLGTDLTNSAAVNTLVYPRDIIQISRAGVVYVLGAFKSQGALPLDQSMPLTLMQVAALSGGVGFEGRYNDLRLIRTFNGERRVVQVDIKKVLNGKAPDPILQANDIVFLPTDQMKAAAKNLGVGGVIGLIGVFAAIRSF